MKLARILAIVLWCLTACIFGLAIFSVYLGLWSAAAMVFKSAILDVIVSAAVSVMVGTLKKEAK